MVGTRTLGFEVKKKDLGKYHNHDFWVWLDYWWWWHEKGLLPLSLPWTEHPKPFIEMIQAMENLYTGYWREKHSDH